MLYVNRNWDESLLGCPSIIVCRVDVWKAKQNQSAESGRSSSRCLREG
jgi:hypothetical protein